MNVIGIDIGGTKCIISLAQWSGNRFRFLHIHRFLTEVQRGPEVILAEIEKYVATMVEFETEISAIGISCGGPLDTEQGVILSPPNLPGWDAVPIVERFAKHFGIPVYLENDANASALAEWRFGAGQGTNDFVFLTFGTGLGAGLIFNGILHRGMRGMAGELGHWRIAKDFGPLNYGKQGSFQGYCSGHGIAAWYTYLARVDDNSMTAEKVARMARQGDALALEVYRQAGEQLGRGLSLLMDLLAPEMIVIGGIFGYAKDLLWPHAQPVMMEETLPITSHSSRIRPSALGSEIGNYAGCVVAIAGLAHFNKVTG